MGDAPVHRLRAIRVVELGAHDVVMDADGEEVVVRVTIDTSGPVTVWHPDPDVFMRGHYSADEVRTIGAAVMAVDTALRARLEADKARESVRDG